MRGLILLGLVGLVLTASTTGLWEMGLKRLTENDNGFNVTTNSTTNSTTVLEEGRGNNEHTALRNGTRRPIDNSYGFPLDDGEDTQGTNKE